VEHLPRARRRQQPGGEPRAEAEAREPQRARDARADGEPPPAGTAVGVGDRAEQNHRVEVDMRVEPGERHDPAHCDRALTGSAAPPGQGRGGAAPRHADATAYQQRKATPTQRTACSAQPACCTITPMPLTPATMSAKSDTAHTATTGPT